MSTASPLPLQPMPPATLSELEASSLKQQVSSRLAEHRQRRGRTVELQPTLPMEGMPAPRNRRVADSVATRFAQSLSYRDFLQQEAEVAIHRATAEAEVARRNAEAVQAVQQQLLNDLEQWNRQAREEASATTAAVVSESNPAQDESVAPSLATLAGAPGPDAQGSVVDPHVSHAHVTATAFELPAEPLEPSTPLPANLIEFPRQLVAARRVRPRLAEGPLRDEADASPERAQLRIFEVEANSVSTEAVLESVLPEWHNIRLDAQDSPRRAEHPDAQISFTLPVHVARSSVRIMAVAVDACCIVMTFLAAVVTAAYASPVLPTGISAAIAAGGTLFLLALMYHLLFFSLSDATPGMRYARIGLCTFGDENPSRASMRRRLFAILLAGMPLGLGLVWACMDEDSLGWHDRISRMYPREY